MQLRLRQEHGLWLAYAKCPQTPTAGPSRPIQRETQLTSRYEYTLLCDGSFKYDIQQAGYGLLLYNSTGFVIDGRAGRLFCKESIVAEAWALLMAIRLATDLIGTINILSDCKVLVQALSIPSDQWPWSCAALLAEIVAGLSSMPSASISFCHRSRLDSVDRVAKSARDGTLLPRWLLDM
ncbi:hypothetical protein LINGRAHAP2_LOCUS22759 [Linum grandiflorum]